MRLHDKRAAAVDIGRNLGTFTAANKHEIGMSRLGNMPSVPASLARIFPAWQVLYSLSERGTGGWEDSR
jgi:hypothetical protein